jgi:hypothetical protein
MSIFTGALATFKCCRCGDTIGRYPETNHVEALCATCAMRPTLWLEPTVLKNGLVAYLHPGWFTQEGGHL